MTHLVCIFHALEKPNKKGELNYYEFRRIDDSHKTIQSIVGGNFELAVHTNRGDDEPFTAYVNEEGLLKDLRRNDLAGGAMYELGFSLQNMPLGGAYAGTVVLMGKDDKGLTENQKSEVEKAIQKYRNSY